jgi:flagellin
MGLRIASNLASLKVQDNLRKVTKDTDRSLQSLSSGKRIISASDDSAGMAIAKTMEAQSRGLRQAERNAQDGISLIQTAEGSMIESSNLLVRLRELAIQSANDTVGERERGMLDLEYQQVIQEIDRIAQSTKFNGVPLINGEGNDLYQFQVGANADESNIIEYDASNIDSTISNLGVDGSGVSEKDDALEAVAELDEAIVQISEQRAGLGAIQNRLYSAVNTINVQALQQDYARSIIEDVDVAEAASNLAADSIQKNASIAALAQANAIPRTALNLL